MNILQALLKLASCCKIQRTWAFVLAGAAFDGSDQGKAEAAQNPVKEGFCRRTKLSSARCSCDIEMWGHAINNIFTSCFGVIGDAAGAILQFVFSVPGSSPYKQVLQTDSRSAGHRREARRCGESQGICILAVERKLSLFPTALGFAEVGRPAQEDLRGSGTQQKQSENLSVCASL